MTQCRYCRGRGVIPVEQPIAKPNVRGAATRMIPYGNDLAAVLAAGRLALPPVLLAGDEPRRDHHGNIVGAWSRWDAAKQAMAAGQPLMVLPAGEEIESFSWPKQPENWRAFWPHSLIVWAWGRAGDECNAIGAALVNAGFDSVAVNFSRKQSSLLFVVG